MSNNKSFHSSIKKLKHFIFSDCDCNQEGSNGVACDNKYGKCYCNSNISGEKCDKCLDGFYEFPNCQSMF